MCPLPVKKQTVSALALSFSDACCLLLSALLAVPLSSLLTWILGTPAFALVKSDNWLLTFWPHAVLTAAALLRLQSKGHYRLGAPAWTEARDLALAFGWCALFETVLFYEVDLHISRLWIAMSWALAYPLVLAVRFAVKTSLVRAGIKQTRVVIFGEGTAAEDVRAALLDERLLGYDVVACIQSHPENAASVALAHKADLAVVVPGSSGSPGLIRALSRAGIQCASVPDLGGIALSGMDTQFFVGREVLLMVEHNNLSSLLARTAKRTFDITLSALALVVLFPAILAVGLLVRRDGGPVFFSHNRIGRGGAHFPCHKFRTMVPDAQRVLEDHLAACPSAREEWDRTQKLRKDPRVTRLGAFLRKSALDEIPQFLNVLMGQMSLVGPRPIIAEEMGRYGVHGETYLKVRPGLTGLWQVSGRNDTGYERRVALDEWYVRNWSLWADVAIIALTVPAVIGRRGAY